MNNKITAEQMEQFFEFLQGEIPDGWTFAEPPQLTPRQAFSVIHYLQEQLRLLPDNYEICDGCGDIFDADEGGVCIDFDAHPDEWHEAFGVTAENIKAHEGKRFCTEPCEASFWREAVSQ